jgi:hypothetical protein
MSYPSPAKSGPWIGIPAASARQSRKWLNDGPIAIPSSLFHILPDETEPTDGCFTALPSTLETISKAIAILSTVPHHGNEHEHEHEHEALTDTSMGEDENGGGCCASITNLSPPQRLKKRANLRQKRQ